jgi:hypothetical protein
MIEQHMQAMAEALYDVSCRCADVAMNCYENGYIVSGAVMRDISNRLDNVWTKYDQEYQDFKEGLIDFLTFDYVSECDNE